MKRKMVMALLCGILGISSLTGCGNTQLEEAEPIVVEEPQVKELTVEEEKSVAVDGAEETEQEQEERYLRLKETEYNADGSVKQLTKYIYNESGNMLKQTSYIADGSRESSIEYEFDEDGVSTKSVIYDADGNITESTEYAETGFGWTTYDADGNEISSYLSEDEFDNNGNQIKSTYHQTAFYDGSLMTYGGVTEYE